MTALVTTSTGLPVKRQAPFIGVQVAQLVSIFGNSLTAIAIPWFVLETTGSAGQTGIIAAAGLIPTVIAFAFGSAAVDRFGFRRMSILADLLSMVTVAAIPLLHLTVGLSFPLLLGLVFLGALFDAPGSTARAAMRPELARMAGITLSRANGIDQGGVGLATLAGPLVGGVLIGLIGPGNVLWFNAAAFAISVLLVAVIVPVVRRDPEETPATTSYLAEVRAGWRFVLGLPLIRRIMLVSTAINFVTTSVFAVLIPTLVNQEIGEPRVLGVLFAAFSVGSLLGIGYYSWRGDHLPRHLTSVVGIGAFGAICGALAAGLPWQAIALVILVAGILAAPVNPIVMTILQELVPSDMLGRVMGAVFASSLLATPVGVLVAGTLAEVIGLPLTFLGATVVMLAVVAWMAFDPVLRRIGDRPPVATVDDWAEESPAAAQGDRRPDLARTA